MAGDVEALLQAGRTLDCKSSGMMAAAEWLLIRDRQGGIRKLQPNAAQTAYELRRGRQNIVLKARQMGITTWIAGRFFLRTITHPGMLTVLVAQDREAAESTFAVVQRMWENLPPALRKGPLRRRKSNARQMVFAGLDSEFRVVSAADASAGRGLSIQNLHCSEVSHWPGDAAATLAGLRAALAPDGELVLESTPNGAYGAFYDEWMRGVDEAGGAGHGDAMVRHFFPWWMEEAYAGEAVPQDEWSEEECGLAAQHGLSLRQIGFRRGLQRSFGGLRAQEFAEDALSCFRATGQCYFDLDALEQRSEQLRDVAAVSRRGGSLRIWLPPLPVRRYIVAVDSAGGGERGDFAAVQVIDAASGAQCAELQERLNPLELARVAAGIAREYGEAVIAVERNNHGSAVLAYLETVERYGNIYRQSSGPGWLTSAATKPEMVSALAALLVERGACFLSERLLAECRTFVRERGGRCGAAAGAHDDLVMAMAIAQAVRSELAGTA